MKRLLIICLFFISCTERVTRCKDADTFVLSTGEVIRLWEVDAIELSQPYGVEAKRFADSVLLGKNVRITRHGHDRYRRSLAEVRINGASFAQMLLSNGYAFIYYRYCHNAHLIAIFEKAKRNKAGAFALPYYQSPASYRYSRKH